MLQTIDAENQTIDSLNTELSNELNKFKRIDLLNLLFNEQYPSDYKKALEFAQEALEASYTIKPVNEKVKYCISESANNVGAGYLLLDNYEKSLKFLLISLKVAEEIQDTSRMSNALYNLSIVYDYMGDLDKSILYLKKGIVLDNAKGDMESVALGYSTISANYFYEGEYNDGMIYYEKAMEILLPMNDLSSLAVLYGNRAIGLNKIKRYQESIEFHQLAIDIDLKLNNKQGLETDYLNIADVYMEMGKNQQAIKYNIKSLELAKELKSTSNIMLAYSGLSESYQQIGDKDKAIEYLLLFTNWKDTLYNQENANAIAEMQTKYETEKKETENSLLLAENKLDKAEISRKSSMQIILVLGLIIALLVVVYVVYSLNEKKKTNRLLNSKNEEITVQHSIIEEKNKDITDSINYAQRIQDAILPVEGLLKSHFESFIFYRPKDIVSGDFYWIKEVDNKIFFSVVDCTGHGVPGAFMSIIGANSLNKIVEDLKIYSTGEILDELNQLVNKSLGMGNVSTDEVASIRDGMDICICSIDKLTNTLEYSGANNSLYLLRDKENIIEVEETIMDNEGTLFYEIKPDKMAIGGGGNKSKYKTHQFSLKKNDALYLFSDGYADQFGGPKGKKFMYKSFKKMFLSIHHKDMDTQLSYIDNTMKDWKMDNKQLDDICVMGVKI
ncbi:tetratricopeptide repeat protein [Vicingaceae bacterium]|nr:tetratricopeptide repeat protein [Vicingaceae bacterium]